MGFGHRRFEDVRLRHVQVASVRCPSGHCMTPDVMASSDPASLHLHLHHGREATARRQRAQIVIPHAMESTEPCRGSSLPQRAQCASVQLQASHGLIPNPVVFHSLRSVY
jgi:hypothetical protein